MSRKRISDWEVVWSSVLDMGGTWLERCTEEVNGVRVNYYMLRSNFAELHEEDVENGVSFCSIHLHSEDMKDMIEALLGV